MDHRMLKLHRLEINNGYDVEYLQIDGSDLTTTTADAGVVVGLAFAQAKDSTNRVTITFREALDHAPKAFYQSLTAAADVQPVSSSTTELVYDTVLAADNSTASADADVSILLLIPRGLSVS